MIYNLFYEESIMLLKNRKNTDDASEIKFKSISKILAKI